MYSVISPLGLCETLLIKGILCDGALLRTFMDHVIECMFKAGVLVLVVSLGLEEVGQPKTACPTSTSLKLPEELPSIEEKLKTLSVALKALEQ